MLTTPELILVAIIVGLFVLIFTTQLKVELIALIVLLTLSFSGLVTTEQALSGFSSSVVITLIGLFIITHALEETGVVQWIATRLNQIGGGSEVKLITLFMFAGAALSLIMNNVAAGAVLLPAAVRVAGASDVRVSKLLMPMSFGTLVGGMATYLTTANIVMSELLLAQGFEGLGMLDFIPVGGLIVLAALVYMLLIGRHLLPNRQPLTRTFAQAPHLPTTYQLQDRFWEVSVPAGAPLAGKTLHQSGIGELLGLTVAGIWRGRATITAPAAEVTLQPDDRLLVIGREERVEHLERWGGQVVPTNGTPNYDDLLGDTVEIVVAPRSAALGKTLTQLRLRQDFGVLAVALWRGNRSYRTDVGKMPLQVGDALLVKGTSAQVAALADDRNYIVPESGYTARAPRPGKALLAVLITAVVLTVAILDWLPLPLMMLAGAVAMVLSGSLSMDEFYEAVEWRVIFLVAAMLPLSIAIAETGLADRVGTLFVAALAGAGPLVLIAGMCVLTMLVVQVIGGQITALLVGPIAITAALQTGTDPQAMAVAVAMSCSMAFLTPIAHPVNILMMSPGGYAFRDFFKVGLGMTLVTLATLVAGFALLWGVG